MGWHDASAQWNHPEVLAFLNDLPEHQRARVQAVRELVHDVAPEAKELIKWGVPMWVLPSGPYCYVSPAQAHLGIGFFRGTEIYDISGKLKGTGKSSIRKCIVKWGDELPEELEEWLTLAAELLPEDC